MDGGKAAVLFMVTFMPKAPKPQKTQKSSIENMLLQGQEHFSGPALIATLYTRSRYAECKREAEKFLKREPNHRNVLMILGATYINLNELHSARTTFERLCKKYPKDADALNNLGTTYYKLGKYSKSEICYANAYKLGKRNADFYINFSNALKSNNKISGARDLLHEATKVNPRSAISWVALCNLALDTGDVDAAMVAANTAVKVDTNTAITHAALGAVYFQLEKFHAAIQHYKTAVRLPNAGPKEFYSLGCALGAIGEYEDALHATLQAIAADGRNENYLQNAAWLSLQMRKYDEALELYSKVLTINPTSVNGFSGIGAVYFAQKDYPRSIEFFTYARSHSPDNIEVAINLVRSLSRVGANREILDILADIESKITRNDDLYSIARCFEDIGDLDNAVLLYSRLQKAEYNPTRVSEHLFNIFEMRSQLNEARQALDKIREEKNASNLCNFLEGIFLCRQRNYAESIRKLNDVNLEELAPESRIRYYSTRGEALDKLNVPDAAFECFKSMNDISATTMEDAAKNADDFLMRLKGNKHYFGPTEAPPTLSLTNPTEVNIGFIVGFPRSGTTLLDSVLRSHSQIDVVEERPMLEHALRMTFQHADKPLDEITLSDFDIDKLTYCRRAYFQNLAFELSHSCSKPNIVFDKLPLHLLRLPIIHAIFPNAPIIFAVRHPLDAIFSNYMQNFKLNSAMACMLTLEQACALYSQAMEVVEDTLENTDIELTLYRYESIISEFEGEFKEILFNIGLEWEDSLLEYRTTALSRKKINTPSYRQVTQPIYSEAIYRWEKYSKYLLPYKDGVQPFIDRLGYNPDYEGPLYRFVPSRVSV